VAKKEVKAVLKLQAPGGSATPGPPIGPALGQHGVNIGQFVQQFNAQTGELKGMPVGVLITIYADRTFTFEVKSPPAAVLIKDAIKLEKGSGTAGKEKVGTVTREQVQQIAKRKMADLNAASPEAACRTIAGTARSMGVDVVD